MRMAEHDRRSLTKILVSTLLIATTLSGILLLGANTMVMAQSIDDYVGPETCKICHEDKYEEWKETPMASAFAHDHFQSEWESLGSPSECLECHTTGFDAASGEYAFEGVTCESCHEAGLTMTVNTSPELCGNCHTGPHGKERFEAFLNGTHSSSGVTCVDCHMYNKNHSFEVESKACAVCHTEDDIHDRRLILTLQSDKLDAADRYEEILRDYEELQTILEEEEGKTLLITYVTYGGGALIAMIAVIIAIYYNRTK